MPDVKVVLFALLKNSTNFDLHGGMATARTHVAAVRNFAVDDPKGAS
jgi:hypothetical protein